MPERGGPTRRPIDDAILDETARIARAIRDREKQLSRPELSHQEAERLRREIKGLEKQDAALDEGRDLDATSGHG